MIGDSRRLPWMWTMRRLTVCLLLSLVPLAVLASDRPVDGDHDSCISDNSAARGSAHGGEPATRTQPHKPAPSSGGGGDTEGLLPRARMLPQWHSFLPGMFR
ncbi:hypothetical protein ACCQ13_19135 [Xanthomonas sp. NCPPB 1638]|uniref:hypothetical protein n=1 Tax=Xanthomonas TaxID=338 RepID=UPI00132E949D|nr:hypothetical protein [Xanthomonas cucurbitae]QHG88679.1 hypothetical protein EBN15_18715 [Xanthomonas cucurbitae]WDM75266.1 hypothetical protein K6982_18335 [Xanthomonas cucurbitae]